LNVTVPANLIAVRSDVAASLLIDGLLDEAVARLGDQLPESIDRALAQSSDRRLARLGYLARSIELERFEVARAPLPWLVERVVAEPEASIAVLAAAIAGEEPLDKPAPTGGAPSWRVPGPGGHVRHFLALRAAGPDGAPEAKRTWMFGFFIHCCGDANDVRVRAS
jgi:hypothetical protein